MKCDSCGNDYAVIKVSPTHMLCVHCADELVKGDKWERAMKIAGLVGFVMVWISLLVMLARGLGF